MIGLGLEPSLVDSKTQALKHFTILLSITHRIHNSHMVAMNVHDSGLLLWETGLPFL